MTDNPFRLGSKEYDTEVNEPHCANPQPGDYWHEMFCPYFVVLARIGKKVLICDKKQEVDANHWTWDLDDVDVISLERLRDRVTYGSGHPGFVADCMPAAHMWAVKEVVGDIK